MNKRLLNLLNGRPELLKYVKQSRNMERKKMAWNLIVNQKKYANMDLEWYKSKEAYAILKKVLMKLVNEQLGGMGVFSCFGQNCNPDEEYQTEMADKIIKQYDMHQAPNIFRMIRLYKSFIRYPNSKLLNDSELKPILKEFHKSIMILLLENKQNQTRRFQTRVANFLPGYDKDYDIFVTSLLSKSYNTTLALTRY